MSLVNANYLSWLTHLRNLLVSTSPTVTTTTASTVYPAANLSMLPTTQPWRSTSVSGNQDIEIDFGVDVTVDVVAIVNHNVSNAATVTIAAGTTTAYSGFSTSMTWRQYTLGKILTTPQIYRYWRIRINDATNTDGFLEAGYIMVGQLTAPEFTTRQGWTTTPEIGSSYVETEFGVPFIEQLFNRQRIVMDFGPLDADEMLVLRSLYLETKRNVYPVLIFPVRSGTDVYFCRLKTMFEERIDFYRYARIEFVEDPFGAAIEA